MEIKTSMVERVFMEWGRRVDENEINPMERTEDNAAEYSKAQAKYFIKLIEELGGGGAKV